MNRPGAAGERGPHVVADDAAPVGVGQQHVVVLGEEARRAGGVGIGTRTVRDVEELAPVLVPERTEARAEALDHLSHTGQARPRRHVRHGGRAEGGEVTQHHLVDRRVLDQGPAEP